MFWNKKKKVDDVGLGETTIAEDDNSMESSLQEEIDVEQNNAEEKTGFFSNLFAGLKKTRDKITSSLNAIFMGGDIDDDFYEELEETLIMSDMGIDTTEWLIEDLKKRVKATNTIDRAACRELLLKAMVDRISVEHMEPNYPLIILLVGVNGVGKTTTAGKLAAIYKSMGKNVILAAADTFRAGAIEQLKIWADRADVSIIKGNDGGDPSAVVFDAIAASKARNTDVLIVDTAGRLHNKKNLMSELSKIRKVIDKEFSDAVCTTYVVLDGTTGQNAMAQAKEFHEVTFLDGIILTKLDGTAKGGIAFAIRHELNLPIRYIGVGEKLEDLQDFNAESFVKALLGDKEE